jgi:hypothetical protein
VFTLTEKLLEFILPMSSKEERNKTRAAIEEILRVIIDEWYEKVSGYYITREKLDNDPNISGEEELKRFHDKNGHRIKFSKDELDFTYGLRSFWEKDLLMIEISVNNKVENFSIESFQRKLADHFNKAGKENAPTPSEIKNRRYEEVFQLDSNFNDVFKVEIREGKADIMRLSFRLNPDLLPKIVARPVASKSLVESYCVTPFRKIYAEVYRS